LDLASKYPTIQKQEEAKAKPQERTLNQLQTVNDNQSSEKGEEWYGRMFQMRHDQAVLTNMDDFGFKLEQQEEAGTPNPALLSPSSSSLHSQRLQFLRPSQAPPAEAPPLPPSFSEQQFQLLVQQMNLSANSTRLDVAQAENQRLLNENRAFREETWTQRQTIDDLKFTLQQHEKQHQLLPKDPLTGLPVGSQQLQDKVKQTLKDNAQLKQEIHTLTVQWQQLPKLEQKVAEYCLLADDLMASNSYLLNFVAGYEKLQDEIHSLNEELNIRDGHLKELRHDND